MTLFIGSSVCHLAPVQGQIVSFDAAAFHCEPMGKEHVLRLKKRTQARSDLGVEYANIVVPAIPAPDIRVDGVQQKGIEGFPCPLVKVPEEKGEEVGIVSGIRSAILQRNGIWYRLKGCGNVDQGFITRPLAGSKDCIEIRGSCFEHTCRRELYMTHYLSTILEQHGGPWRLASTPLGYFKYDIPSFQYPKIPPCCAVFACAAEKRLGDHILTGLEMLLPYLFSRVSNSDVLTCLPEYSRVDGDDVQSTWMALLMDSQLIHGDIALQGDSTRVRPGFAAQQDWEMCLRVLPSSNSALFQLLCRLYRRFGVECGFYLDLFHRHDINWGTYSDTLGNHCNAHANNFALLLEQDQPSCLLAPLDFDMAFTRDTYISLADTSDPFSDLMKLERKGLEMTLAGDDFISSGVASQVNLEPAHANLRWILRYALALIPSSYRDQLIHGYRDDTAAAGPLDGDTSCVFYSLLRLALHATRSVTS